MVARFLDLNNLSWQRRPFALSGDGRKLWATILFLSAIIHRSHACQIVLFFFFLPYLQDHALLRSRSFATMVTWRNDFSSLFLLIRLNSRFCECGCCKVAEHSFGSLWVYFICQIMARERFQLTSWNLAREKYTDERFWVTGKIWFFRSFHGNMNDWIQLCSATWTPFKRAITKILMKFPGK